MSKKTIEDIRSEFVDSKFVFVHQADNWADEIDINGYAVFNKAEFDSYLSYLETLSFSITRFFGTNEEGEYDSLADYLYWLRIKEITQTEYKAFITMFESTKSADFWIPEPNEDEDEDFDSDEDDDLY